VQLFAIRDGKTTNRDIFLLENLGDGSDEEALTSFVRQFYARAGSIPPRVLVPLGLPEADELEESLASRAGRRVELVRPQRGEGRQLMELAARNAAEALAREQVAGWPTRARPSGRSPSWRCAGAARSAARIECYDISTIQGTRPWAAWSSSRRASRARASTGASASVRSSARTTSPATRRCCATLPPRARREEGDAEQLRWRLPDLVIIDGGKGQVARLVRSSMSWACTTCPGGLAKEREELFLPASTSRSCCRHVRRPVPAAAPA